MVDERGPRILAAAQAPSSEARAEVLPAAARFTPDLYSLPARPRRISRHPIDLANNTQVDRFGQIRELEKAKIYKWRAHVIGRTHQRLPQRRHMSALVTGVTVVILVGLGLAAGPARAEDAPPWAQGVPQPEQDRANALFDEGNQLFAQQAHGPALEKYRAAIALVSLEAASNLAYPHPRWIPWTIAGSGIAIAAGGLGLYLVGKNEMDSFHNDFASLCARGCDADLSDQPVLRRDRDGAVLKGQIAASMMITGSVVTVSGIVLTILNRPVRKLPRIEATPTRGGLEASVSWSF